MKQFLTSKCIQRFMQIVLISTIFSMIFIIHQQLSIENKKSVDIDSISINQSINELQSESHQSETSHPLENLCKYPILIPNEETLKENIRHPREINCTKVQQDYVTFDDSTSTIYVNRTLAKLILDMDIICSYRPFEGTLKPSVHKLVPTKNWTVISEENTVIADDQFEVKCFMKNDSKSKVPVFKWAFAQIGSRPVVLHSKNTVTRLSVDMILFDSTSLNQFRRHMLRTNEYMMKEMKFSFMEGYTKVADNSMVNLLPVLAGKRYHDHSYKEHKLPSDLPINVTLDMDAIPFIWKDFAAKNCSTYFNDDIHDKTRGVFHYPWNAARGFKYKPTDYFFRPWHVWHRTNKLENSSSFCFGNVPYTKLQLQLVKQFIKNYNDRCHFSFSFFCEISHDSTSNLERMDDDMRQFLEAYHRNHDFNHTVLIIMGDHGQRMNFIKRKYIGRIEERMPLFAIYFPEWFRKLHPGVMENLNRNKNRLISNFDIYKTLKDIVDERFDAEISRDGTIEPKGQSLLTKISSNRDCFEANIPDNHCTCLEMVEELNSTDLLHQKSIDVVLYHTRNLLKNVDQCRNITSIMVDHIATYTTNNLVQHGVRNPNADGFKDLLKPFDDTIEYVEIIYRMVPIDIYAKIRLQHNKKLKKLFVNSGPMVLNGNFKNPCSAVKHAPNFCVC